MEITLNRQGRVVQSWVRLVRNLNTDLKDKKSKFSLILFVYSMMIGLSVAEVFIWQNLPARLSRSRLKKLRSREPSQPAL